jgi:hypothetical protein
VGRRAVALLRVLVEHPGALLSKEALIEAAWGVQVIEESNLPVQIAALRRVLGKEPGVSNGSRRCLEGVIDISARRLPRNKKIRQGQPRSRRRSKSLSSLRSQCFHLRIYLNARISDTSATRSPMTSSLP